MTLKKTSKSPQILTIIGNIGSGKSSATPIISQAISAYEIDADNLFQTTDPFRDGYLQDRERWAFTNELWLTYERTKILRHELAQTNQKWVVVDSGLLMSWVYAYSHWLKQTITLAEWEFFMALYDEFTLPLSQNLIVLSLHYPIPTLLKRIKARGREFEITYYDAKYLEQLEEGIAALESRLESQRVKLIRVEEKTINDFVKSPKDKEQLIEMIKLEI